jgi:hypothetical protein
MCIFEAVALSAAGATMTGAAATSAVAAGTAAWSISPLAALGMNAAIGTTIVSGLGTPIYSYFAQQDAANKQASYQNSMYAANKQIAEQSLLSQYADVSMRQQQEAEKAAQEMGVIAAQAREARSTALTSSMESGVSGLSVDNLMADYFRKESSALVTTQKQLKNTLFQFERTKTGLGAEYQARVLGMTPQPVEYPSIVATGLRVGGAAAGIYSDLYMNTQDRQILRTGLRI